MAKFSSMIFLVFCHSDILEWYDVVLPYELTLTTRACDEPSWLYKHVLSVIISSEVPSYITSLLELISRKISQTNCSVTSLLKFVIWISRST